MNLIDFKIVEEFERPGPRYTSYPTAPVWKSQFTGEELEAALRTSIKRNSALSLYLHLPFCQKLCHFCACNKVIDSKREHSSIYLDAIIREVELLCDHLAGSGQLEQMHWGGGTPTFYSPSELEKLFTFLNRKFSWGQKPEISIEANPVVTTKEHLQSLGRLGFNRLSFGVQDFDEKVQDAINRHQTFEQTKGLAEYARRFGFVSLNLDLIYGLPLQSKDSISKTIAHVLEIRPERIALYSYANVPWKYPFQRRFKEGDLPKGSEKISLYLVARELLLAAGYAAIGMDHFALPQDELFQARRQKTLHRNFMGYTTRGDAQMVSAGISAISMLNGVYTQNKKTLPSYYADLKQNKLPVDRGLHLSLDDQIRRKLIIELMCNFELSYHEYESAYHIHFETYFDREFDQLRSLEKKGLLELRPGKLFLTSQGQVLVRNIAMVFDVYLDKLPDPALFSQTI